MESLLAFLLTQALQARNADFGIRPAGMFEYNPLSWPRFVCPSAAQSLSPRHSALVFLIPNP